ncbi:MAG: DUF4159 domain-containing protein [Aphanizomenon sp.]|jgi:hypothetical protein
MTKPWSEPEKQPLKRLEVTDGLLINSKKWHIAHNYHHQRQNLHYQSLNQAGIVCGLGVRLLKKTATRTEYEFVLKFQPGIAIDRYGNCIILEQEREKVIAAQVIPGESLLVYFVISYKEPSQLKNLDGEVTEEYEIKERTDSPQENEVELCRVNLTAPKNIKVADNVFDPQDNELDFRYRYPAKWRPLSIIRTAIYTNLGEWQEVFSDDIQPSNFSYLLQSLDQLYPALGTLKISDKSSLNSLLEYDLISLTDQQFQDFQQQQIDDIKKYLETGGVILIEHSKQSQEIGQFMQIKQELQQDIIDTEKEVELNDDREILLDELRQITNRLESITRNIAEFYNQKFKTNLESIELIENHPLRKTPFLFNQLPSVNKQPILVLNCEGIIVVIGNLSSAWGLNGNLSLSRETIRSAQEMGMNILHFAWRRRELTQLVK